MIAAAAAADEQFALVEMGFDVRPISTAVLNAYVSPSIVSYVRRLAEALAERGLRGPFYVVQNNAGAMTVAANDGTRRRTGY